MKNKVYRISQIKKLIEKSRFSNIGKSVRRIYFNGLFESTAERGYWHIDTMSGMGSCVLLHYDNKFFLLTANHVLKDTTDKDGNFQNESPFWSSVKHKASWESMYDFFMPKKIWNIGELINADERIITSDVCLIELYYPYLLHMPDNFINVDQKTFSKKEDFFMNKILLVSGYPFEKNYYDWDVNHPTCTHGTSIIRHTITGQFIDDDALGYISFQMIDGGIQHADGNGMSGGVVYDVHHKANQTKFCGMILTMGNNMCHFIPSYLLYDAIVNYKQSTFIIVDPAENEVPDPEKALEHLKYYFDTFVH